MQVLLVTGGRVSPGIYLDSTELLYPSATSWSYSGALPSTRGWLRGATLDNKVVVAGTNIDTLIIYSVILHRQIILLFKICLSISYRLILLCCYKYYIIHNTGGYEYFGRQTYFDDVLVYDEEEQVWIKVGVMSQKKREHAVSVINFNSIKDYCN